MGPLHDVNEEGCCCSWRCSPLERRGASTVVGLLPLVCSSSRTDTAVRFPGSQHVRAASGSQGKTRGKTRPSLSSRVARSKFGSTAACLHPHDVEARWRTLWRRQAAAPAPERPEDGQVRAWGGCARCPSSSQDAHSHRLCLWQGSPGKEVSPLSRRHAAACCPVRVVRKLTLIRDSCTPSSSCSFILNALARKAAGGSAGFAVGPTQRPCTKGLWMWSQPIPQTAPDGSKCAICGSQCCRWPVSTKPANRLVSRSPH